MSLTPWAAHTAVAEIQDLTPPVVTGTPDRAPGFGGVWTEPVTITWSAVDPEPSSGTPTTPRPTLVEAYGVQLITSEPSCDPAGNCASGTQWVSLLPDPVTISLWVDDAPVVATPSVTVAVVLPDYAVVYGEHARYAEDPTLVDGVLAAGTDVPLGFTWPLPPGPDGPRTVYVQAYDRFGNWSPVASATVTLTTAGRTLVAVDSDVGGAIRDGGQEVRALPEYRTGADGARAGPGTVTIGSGPLGSVSIQLLDAARLEPGHTYEIMDSDRAVLLLSDRMGGDGRCSASGWYRVDELVFSPEGDVASAAIDLRLQCFNAITAGSIRYASDVGFVALGQSTSHLVVPGHPEVGQTTEPQSIVFTNSGTEPNTFGTALLADGEVGDFAIVSDECSGVTLAPGDACGVSIAMAPVHWGMRRTWLVIPDETPRGSRQVMITGWARERMTAAMEIVSVAQFGPGPVVVTVTTTPVDAPASPSWYVDGEQVIAAGGTHILSDPPRVASTYSLTLSPGTHVLEAVFGMQPDGYLIAPDPLPPQTVVLGTSTWLKVDVPDWGVVLQGEPVSVAADLWAAAPITGGNLTLRDAATGEVLAQAEPAGQGTRATLTRAFEPGEHSFSATFEPASADIQPASAGGALTAVQGPRPETTILPGPRAGGPYANLEFTSPTPGAGFDCRADSFSWYHCSSPHTFQVEWREAVHRLQVRARRSDGLVDASPAWVNWTVDMTAPAASVRPLTIAEGSRVDTSRVVLKVSWSGSDAASGIASFELQAQVDGGAWKRIVSTRSTSVLRYASFGHRIAFRVRAIDGAGNAGEWATTPTVRPTLVSDGSWQHSGGWFRHWASGLLGASDHLSSRSGASAWYTFTGRAVAFVTRRGPSNGSLRVSVTGTAARTISTHASTWVPRITAGSVTWPDSRPRTIRVTCLGSRYHPWVEVDGVIVLR